VQGKRQFVISPPPAELSRKQLTHLNSSLTFPLLQESGGFIGPRGSVLCDLNFMPISPTPSADRPVRTTAVCAHSNARRTHNSEVDLILQYVLLHDGDVAYALPVCYTALHHLLL